MQKGIAMPVKWFRGTLCAVLALLLLISQGRSQTQPGAPSTLVTGKLVVPAAVDSFTDRTLEVLLFEYDPRLADAPAARIDQLTVKPFNHEKGRETSRDLMIGAAGTRKAGRSYYVTAFVLDGTTRTHIGELDGKSGLANVLTGGIPSEIKLVFRAVR